MTKTRTTQDFGIETRRCPISDGASKEQREEICKRFSENKQKSDLYCFGEGCTHPDKENRSNGNGGGNNGNGSRPKPDAKSRVTLSSDLNQKQKELVEIVFNWEEEADSEETIFCAAVKAEVPASFCSEFSTDFETRRHFCSAAECSSPHRVCPMCKKQGYVKRAIEKDYLSVDRRTGFCRYHTLYGFEAMRVVSSSGQFLARAVKKKIPPLRKSSDDDQSVSVKKTIVRKVPKPVNHKKESAMPTGVRISPADLLKIGKEASRLMQKEGKSKKATAKILKTAVNSVERAMLAASLCGGAQEIFSRSEISAKNIILLEGLSEKAQIDLALKLDTVKNDSTMINGALSAIAFTRKKEGVEPKKINLKKVKRSAKPVATGGDPGGPSSPPPSPDTPASPSSDAPASHHTSGRDVCENMWPSQEDFDEAEQDVSDVLSRFEGVFGASDEGVALTLSRNAEELIRIISKKGAIKSSDLPIGPMIINSLHFNMRALTLTLIEQEAQGKKAKAAEEAKKAEAAEEAK